MRRSVTNPQPELQAESNDDLGTKTTDEDALLQARLSSRGAEWVSTVSYYNDYLTIMDLQRLTDERSRRAG